MTKPKVSIHLNDGLADVYAFATLYEYLVENGLEADFKIVYVKTEERDIFVDSVKKYVRKKTSELSFLKRCDFLLDGASEDLDLKLKGYCDLTDYSYDKDVAIDLSILKNCVKPISEERRIELRQKYNIPLEEKVLVLGCPSFPGPDCYQSIPPVIFELCSHAKIYLVGSTGFLANIELHKEMNGLIKNINEHGVLKDYYAMADVTLINRNVTTSCSTMHNFVEATAGGPLFLVPPVEDFRKQYGYKQLVQVEAISEAENTDDLIAKVKLYLENPNGEQVREKRRQHLDNSRELYLKDLHRLINKLLRIKDEPFESDLEFYSNPQDMLGDISKLSNLMVLHPETDWGVDSFQKRNPLLKELHSKTIEDSCFRRVETGE